MRRTTKFACFLAAVALCGAGLMGGALVGTNKIQAAQPEFAPGKKVTFKVANWVIEGTVAEPTTPNERVSAAFKVLELRGKARQLVNDDTYLADGTPTSEKLFHDDEEGTSTRLVNK